MARLRAIAVVTAKFCMKLTAINLRACELRFACYDCAWSRRALKPYSTSSSCSHVLKPGSEMQGKCSSSTLSLLAAVGNETSTPPPRVEFTNPNLLSLVSQASGCPLRHPRKRSDEDNIVVSVRSLVVRRS